MPRKARIVIPGLPHHVTQRGNYKQSIFESRRDYVKYLYLMKERSIKYKVDIISYCLMKNHVHFVVVPDKQDSCARLFRDVHAFYSRYKHSNRDKKGHLWQGRYYSCVMSDSHLYQAIRYVEMNPVRAGIVRYPGEYFWSSAREHLGMESNPVLRTKNIEFYGKKLVSSENWYSYLNQKDDNLVRQIRKMTKSGKVLGDDDFVSFIERRMRVEN